VVAERRVVQRPLDVLVTSEQPAMEAVDHHRAYRGALPQPRIKRVRIASEIWLERAQVNCLVTGQRCRLQYYVSLTMNDGVTDVNAQSSCGILPGSGGAAAVMTARRWHSPTASGPGRAVRAGTVPGTAASGLACGQVTRACQTVIRM